MFPATTDPRDAVWDEPRATSAIQQGIRVRPLTLALYRRALQSGCAIVALAPRQWAETFDPLQLSEQLAAMAALQVEGYDAETFRPAQLTAYSRELRRQLALIESVLFKPIPKDSGAAGSGDDDDADAPEGIIAPAIFSDMAYAVASKCGVDPYTVQHTWPLCQVLSIWHSVAYHSGNTWTVATQVVDPVDDQWPDIDDQPTHEAIDF